MKKHHRLGVALVALLIGATLYLGGRPTSLRMFGWADAIGLGGLVEGLRLAIGPTMHALPRWVVFSLPFGLWVTAATLMVRDSRWAPVALVMAIAAELGQLAGLVPGSFDPVDLVVVIVCGVLPLLHRPPRVAGDLRPAAATLMFAVLAAGTTESEEEKAARKEKEAEELKKLDEYEANLKKLHDNIAKLDLPSLKAKPCKSVKVELPKDSTGLRTVELTFLERFGNDKEKWTKLEKPWDFLTDSTFGGHFDTHRSERTEYAVLDTAERVQETFLPEKYLIVIAPVAKDTKVAPVMKDKHFEGGYLGAWVFLGDQGTGEVACQTPIEVESSDEIDFGGILDSDDPEHEMWEDFEDNIEGAINKVLPKGIEISSLYGSIVR